VRVREISTSKLYCFQHLYLSTFVSFVFSTFIIFDIFTFDIFTFDVIQVNRGNWAPEFRHCPNFIGISTAVEITMEFGQCQNFGAQILTTKFP
jgi:hypothetical protein